MQYKRVRYYIPNMDSSILGGMSMIGGKQYIRNEKPETRKECVSLEYNAIDVNDPLFCEKQYVEMDYWPKLEEVYAKDNTGFFASGKMLKPQLTMDDIHEKIPYNDNTPCYTQFQTHLRDKIHIGQRKLFLTEIQHLAANLKSPNDSALVIYAGSAPSNKAWLMHQLFPNVKFIFIDPNEFYLYVGKFDLPHYSDTSSGLYCYLSYSNSNQYNSRYPEGRRKHIKYYNYKTGKVDDILDKELGKSLSDKDRELINKRKFGNNTGFRREVKEAEHEVISGYAAQESFDFVFQSDYRFYFCEEYFTDETSTKISAAISKANFAGKVLFWSDIRTNFEQGSHPEDLDLIWNTAMMYSWLRIIKPDYAMVKFRPPFFMSKSINYSTFQNDFDIAKQHGHDFIEGTKQHDGISFFKGVIYIQAWPGNRSTETRLWIDKQDIISNNLTLWELHNFEDRFFYYNTIDRYALLHENSNANKLIGFDHCNDCAIENAVWESLKLIKPDLNILTWVHKLDEVLRVAILDRGRRYCHGHLFPDLTTDLTKWVYLANK